MALIIPNLRTGNVAQPIYGVGATERAIANMPNLLVWLKANDGYFDAGKTKWYDAANATPYPITGGLANSGAVNGVPGAVFTNTQSVDLGTAFPTNADYTIIAVVSPSAFPNAGGIIGSKAVGAYHTLFFNPASGGGNLGVAHGGVTRTDTANLYVANTPLLVGQTFDNVTKLANLYSSGILKYTSPVLAANADSTMVIGDIPALTGTRKLSGVLCEILVFGRDVSKLQSGQVTSDFTTVTNWLKTKYAL